jgi:uncharacterized membrane protein YccC
VKVAIKGGLAAVLGIICLKWLHPPGSGSFPLMAWLVTILGRPFLRAGGSGDLRAFQTALAGSLVLAGCAVLLLLTTPLLANYALMNLALLLVLFAFGFLTVRIAGINFWMQVAFLTISAFVGLNPQEPVASQTIINTFLGLMFGIWTATVVGRLIWPVLPQYVLRDDLIGLCGRLQALLNREPHREKIQAQLAVLPLEALQAVGQLRMAGCSGEERTRLAAAGAGRSISRRRRGAGGVRPLAGQPAAPALLGRLRLVAARGIPSIKNQLAFSEFLERAGAAH